MAELAAPARRRGVYYGWWMVAGAVVAQFVAVGATQQVAGVFLRPMTDDLGWSIAQFALAGSLAFAVTGMAGFVVGPFIDRYGPRPLMLGGGLVYGAALIAASQITAPWQFIALQMLAGGAGNSLTGPLVVNTALSKWFVLRRGWAIALGSMGIGAAGLVVPLTMIRVVDSLGWRDAYVVLGVAVWALILPTALIMRRQPEDYGMLPDGRERADEGTVQGRADLAAVQADYDNSYTRAEAVRTPAVWLITFGMAFFGLGMTAVLLHGIAFMTDAGLTRTQAALALAFGGAGNLLSKFAWGWLLARVHVRVLFAFCFLLAGVGATLMVAADQFGLPWLMHAALFVWGAGFGGGIPLSEFIWAKYYGRRHIGAVRSVGVPFGIIFGASGGLVVARYYDAVGDYTGAWLTLVACYVVGATLIGISREPPPKAAAAASPRLRPALADEQRGAVHRDG
ncbi:MAG: MFS transporter [Chloroflexi bacterium]|nr:MFS transporter [Chloroflexota bacterium]